jgi:hypothetical protein
VISRYEALLKVCDMACAQAAATGADSRSEFYRTLAAALEDDCPEQSASAARVAESLATAEAARGHFLTLLSV